MEEALQRLVDEAAIKDVQLRYCRGIDRRDLDLLRSCYHPDASDDHGEFVGGVEEFLAYVENGTRDFLSTSHQICNQLVEVHGDVAWAEAYVLAYHRLPAGEDGVEKDWICNARFVDRFERRDGEWRIADRKVVVDTDRVITVEECWTERVALVARRDRTDPSYVLQEKLREG